MAVILWAAQVVWSQQPAPAAKAQFAYIRPTYRLTGQKNRTVRPPRESTAAAMRKSGNISPLKRELPQSVAQPPKTRRRQIPW